MFAFPCANSFPQVNVAGRRVLLGWIGGGTLGAQSLARDLTLSQSRELLQEFVPELKALRTDAGTTGLQTEVVASFTFDPSSPPQDIFGVDVACGSADGDACARIYANCTSWVGDQPICDVGVDATGLDVQGR